MAHRILIVNVNWLGDVLFSTPALRAVRKKYPEAFIACLVPPRCVGLLKNNPYLNEVIQAEDRKGSFFKLWTTVVELRRRRFDKALFFHRSRTKAFMAWVAGIPERVGYAGRHRGQFLTRVIPNPARDLHKTDYFLNLLESTGIPADGRVPDFYPLKEAEGELRRLFESHQIAEGTPYAVIHAGGNWELKRWPADHFVKWAKLFSARYPWKIILCGTKPEERLSDMISAHFKNNEVVSFCGKTSLDGLALLLKKAKFLLSNDSGPIHLAATQGTRIVGLFGPTSATLTGPVSEADVLILKKDVGCEVPCYYRSCDHRVCMEWLAPEEVFQKTEAWMSLVRA